MFASIAALYLFAAAPAAPANRFVDQPAWQHRCSGMVQRSAAYCQATVRGAEASAVINATEAEWAIDNDMAVVLGAGEGGPRIIAVCPCGGEES